MAEAVETDDGTARFSLRLEAGEQRILPAMVEWLRGQEVEGIGPADEAFGGCGVRHGGRGRREWDRDGSQDGLAGRERGAVWPLLQWGALRLGHQ